VARAGRGVAFPPLEPGTLLCDYHIVFPWGNLSLQIFFPTEYCHALLNILVFKYYFFTAYGDFALHQEYFFYCSYVEHLLYAQQFLKMHVAQLVAYRTLASWHSLCTNDSYIYKNPYPLYVLYMFQLKWYCVLCAVEEVRIQGVVLLCTVRNKRVLAICVQYTVRKKATKRWHSCIIKVQKCKNLYRNVYMKISTLLFISAHLCRKLFCRCKEPALSTSKPRPGQRFEWTVSRDGACLRKYFSQCI
jgi:hypothetical protein